MGRDGCSPAFENSRNSKGSKGLGRKQPVFGWPSPKHRPRDGKGSAARQADRRLGVSVKDAIKGPAGSLANGPHQLPQGKADVPDLIESRMFVGHQISLNCSLRNPNVRDCRSTGLWQRRTRLWQRRTRLRKRRVARQGACWLSLRRYCRALASAPIYPAANRPVIAVDVHIGVARRPATDGGVARSSADIGIRLDPGSGRNLSVNTRFYARAVGSAVHGTDPTTVGVKPPRAIPSGIAVAVANHHSIAIGIDVSVRRNDVVTARHPAEQTTNRALGVGLTRQKHRDSTDSDNNQCAHPLPLHEILLRAVAGPRPRDKFANRPRNAIRGRTMRELPQSTCQERGRKDVECVKQALSHSHSAHASLPNGLSSSIDWLAERASLPTIAVYASGAGGGGAAGIGGAAGVGTPVRVRPEASGRVAASTGAA